MQYFGRCGAFCDIDSCSFICATTLSMHCSQISYFNCQSFLKIVVMVVVVLLSLHKYKIKSSHSVEASQICIHWSIQCFCCCCSKYTTTLLCRRHTVIQTDSRTRPKSIKEQFITGLSFICLAVRQSPVCVISWSRMVLVKGEQTNRCCCLTGRPVVAAPTKTTNLFALSDLITHTEPVMPSCYGRLSGHHLSDSDLKSESERSRNL